MPRVSVVIPNYNREGLVGETIRNMLEQSLPPVEVIVVDDGSTDRSVEVIKSFGTSVILVEQKNSGPGAARNAGLQLATGDYIQFMDSDDIASKNKLEVQSNLLEKTGADIALSPWVFTHFQGTRVEPHGLVLQQQEPSRRFDMLSYILQGWSTVFQSLLFRRSAVMRGGRYHTDMKNGEDIEFLVRILLAGAKPCFSPDCLTLYRSNSNIKLTGDGVTETHRRADLLLFFDRISNDLKQAKYKPDKLTQLLFQTWIHGALYQGNSTPASEIEQRIKQLVPGPRSPLIKLARTCRTWTRRVRNRLLNRSSWHPAFQTGKLTDEQRQLIRQIGLTLA